MIKIYDNILTEDLIKKLEQDYQRVDKSYVLRPNTLEQKQQDHKDQRVVDSIQFVNVIKGDDQIFDNESFKIVNMILRQITKKLSMVFSDPSRVKYNILTKSAHSTKEEHCFNNPHVDSSADHYVLIYYINDSDGPTYIFEETIEDTAFDDRHKVEKFTIKEVIHSEKGRIVLFDGKYYHASSNPVSSSHRAVINIDVPKQNVIF